MSSPIRVTLVGMCKVDKGFVKARPQDVTSVLYFTGDSVTTKDYFHLQMIGGRYVLTTPRGKYDFVHHPTNNYWFAEANGVKMHIMVKKIVAHLLYWA